VSKGIYAYSRNPIYLGYLIANIGFFMMMPNAINLSIFALSYVVLEVKIRLEKKYLLNKIGINYQSYLDKVRRWVNI
jgi:protein-S-isoprenylcysteine O-methyltransferase Ste14